MEKPQLGSPALKLPKRCSCSSLSLEQLASCYH